MNKQHWIFLSPHLDDVALSCGGLVSDITRSGHRVEVWTFMAGLPDDGNYSAFAQLIQAAWGVSGRDALLTRRAEDRAACAVLGAEVRHCDWLDAIYRRDAQTGEPVVNDLAALFSQAPEPDLVAEIAAMLAREVPEGAHLVMPVGLGGHVDHQAVVAAGERSGRVDFYYADYPYVLEHFDNSNFQAQAWQSVPQPLDEKALLAWQESVLCHSSQLSTFWRDETETRLALRNYLAGGGGRLWVKTRLDRNPPHR
jgi:LmbE family N-acetylglucosaminyl deacetylase